MVFADPTIVDGREPGSAAVMLCAAAMSAVSSPAAGDVTVGRTGAGAQLIQSSLKVLHDAARKVMPWLRDREADTAARLALGLNAVNAPSLIEKGNISFYRTSEGERWQAVSHEEAQRIKAETERLTVFMVYGTMSMTVQHMAHGKAHSPTDSAGNRLPAVVGLTVPAGVEIAPDVTISVLKSGRFDALLRGFQVSGTEQYFDHGETIQRPPQILAQKIAAFREARPAPTADITDRVAQRLESFRDRIVGAVPDSGKAPAV